MDVFEEIFKRQEFENNGIEYDLELKDGIFQAIVKDPDPSFLESIGAVSYTHLTLPTKRIV